MTGRQIFRMRELYGFSLRQVAQEAEISHNLIQLVEKNERTLTADVEEKIMSALYRLNMKAAVQRGKAAKSAKGGSANE